MVAAGKALVSMPRVALLRASRFTTLGTSPVSRKACTIRITSCAIATWAWSVDAPTWWVP